MCAGPNRTLTLLTALCLLLLAGCGENLEYRKIEAFMNETAEWSRQLYSRGGEIGRMLADIIHGKAENGDKARKRIEALKAFIAEGRKDFQSRDLSALPEFSAYREKYDLYLKWESEVIAQNMLDLVGVLERDDMSRTEKGDLLKDLTSGMTRDEDRWQKELERLKAALLKKMNE